MTKKLRDLIYFDFDKAASLWSQFDNGLLREAQEKTQMEGKGSTSLEFALPLVAKLSVAGNLEGSRDTLRTKALHHNLLTNLEDAIRKNRLLCEASMDVPKAEENPKSIRSIISKFPYLSASGHSSFQDYTRLSDVMANFNKLGAFIAKAKKNSAEYKAAEMLLQNAKRAADQEKDKDRRGIQRREIAKAEEELRAQTTQGLAVEEWLVEGTLLWAKTFMPESIVLTVNPFPDCPALSLICFLKRHCFVDEDLSSVLHAYTTAPNVKLGVIGLVTSLPPESTSSAEDAATEAPGSMTAAFAQMFAALDSLEAYSRLCSYPSVALQPIAVYRDF